MTSDHPRTGARVSSGAVTPAFPPVPLGTLVAAVPDAIIRGDGSVLVTDVAFDSREVSPGALFFCVPGLHVDGHAFAAAAVEAGASALVVERWLDVDAPQALVPSVRRAMGPLSAVAFGRPASAMATVGSHRHERQDHRHLPAGVDLPGGRLDARRGGDDRRCRRRRSGGRSRGPPPRRRICTACSR